MVGLGSIIMFYRVLTISSAGYWAWSQGDRKEAFKPWANGKPDYAPSNDEDSWQKESDDNVKAAKSSGGKSGQATYFHQSVALFLLLLMTDPDSVTKGMEMLVLAVPSTAIRTTLSPSHTLPAP